MYLESFQMNIYLESFNYENMYENPWLLVCETINVIYYAIVLNEIKLHSNKTIYVFSQN